MSTPVYTRLRYIKAKDPDELTAFLGRLPYRVQMYGPPVKDGEQWVLWFVPPDNLEEDVPNVDLDI